MPRSRAHQKPRMFKVEQQTLSPWTPVVIRHTLTAHLQNNNVARLTRRPALDRVPELQIQGALPISRNVQSLSALIHVSKRVVHVSAMADCPHVLNLRMIDETDTLTSTHGLVMVPTMVARSTALLEMSEAMAVPQIVSAISQ